MARNTHPFLSTLAVWLLRLVTLYLAYALATFLFLYNPINSKFYSQYSTWDTVWAWISNIVTVVGTLLGWWFIQRSIARMIYGKKEPNQPPQRNAGSRPSSDDSSASETPSSLGPRG